MSDVPFDFPECLMSPLISPHIKPAFEHQEVAKLTLEQVAALHRRIAKDRAPATANRVLALLSVMFSKARTIGFKGVNPCQGVERFREQSRERFLTTDEVPKFFAAIEDPRTPALWRDYFRLLLLTGARSENVQSMRWDEIDLNTAVWHIPQEKAKAKEAITVHLTSDAMIILLTRRNATKSPWVFPSHSKSGHVSSPRSAWAALLKRAGLSGLRMHDLRRTLGSWQAATGASLHVIGKSLGHRAVQTTAIYARLQLDPVRESVNRATEAMKAAIEAAKQKQKTAENA